MSPVIFPEGSREKGLRNVRDGRVLPGCQTRELRGARRGCKGQASASINPAQLCLPAPLPVLPTPSTQTQLAQLPDPPVRQHLSTSLKKLFG